MENRLILGGQVSKASKTRRSPAGIPITQFTLEHSSEQIEAGIPRTARCLIQVLACGTELQQVATNLAIGTKVQVQGFLSRANHRQGESRLVLHARCIEII